ncbi:hypothetical protein MMH03_05890 [Vibrio cholerae]|nr:hypothetical protein [Vibrio cholerae]
MKSSFTNANRSSISAFTCIGIDEGLKILQKAKEQLRVRVLTDVHEDTPLEEVASVRCFANPCLLGSTDWLYSTYCFIR